MVVPSTAGVFFEGENAGRCLGGAAGLTLPHKRVLSSRGDGVSDWERAGSPAEALESLAAAGVEETVVGGGRAVYHAFMAAGQAGPDRGRGVSGG